MNNLVRSVFRIAPLRSIVSPMRSTLGKREFTRTLWHMSRKPEDLIAGKSIIQHNPSLGCSCGCGAKFIHTKGERELVEFLTEEIVAEKKAQKVKSIPTTVEGFKVKINGPEVELTKEGDKETVTISFNVNHTVDTDEEAEVDPNMDKPNLAEMKSKPQFEVDIVRGSQTLSFTCSFLQNQGEDAEGYNDIFGIDELVLYDGEWKDNNYAVAGDVLDGYLYDLLMNLLEEKGISNEFVDKLSEFSTIYEHSQYIDLLERLSKFTIGK
ncbi:complement component 1 Q subcomponent-binding protein, mitochondrial [Phlebotomus argentipes]|uniref:complement component 1 Q subcomponent-binding protein, mitochondrial n=1 Tax=Phlebotomus argentipes TaxID=94469 RepID=UPI002892C738|nr:complement component 1 Q subcomponent-binding protein, mitochondrial [Phlebotomus argentipes]